MNSNEKTFLISENEKILNEIDKKLALYEELSEETIEEYYNRLVASDIKQVLSVEVSENFSLFFLIGIVVVSGLLFVCIIYIWIELLKINKKDISEEKEDKVETEDLDDAEKPMTI